MSAVSNADRIIKVSVMGEVVAPTLPGAPGLPYAISAEGLPFLLPAYGSIVYNVSIGDSAYGWMADCVHPGVSIKLKADPANRGLNVLACVGNLAVVMSGDARGARGVVTGKSGRFSEHVIIHFDLATREKINIGDKIVVRAFGPGFELANHPDVQFKSCDPRLLDALEVTTTSDGKLSVPVVAAVPPHLLGAGAGLTSEGGSLHIQTTDPAALREAGLDKLRLGDVVALSEYDSGWNHGYLRNAIGIGVVAQGDSPRSGYGPGITVLMTSAGGGIAPMVTPGVNLKDLFDLNN
jgi:hypothetical protein